MRIFTRTLPWIVILVVIAFFIALKQSANRSTASISSTEKTVTKTDTASENSTSETSSTNSKKLDVKSETSVAQPEAMEAQSETLVAWPEASENQPEATILSEGSDATETEEGPGNYSWGYNWGPPAPSESDIINLRLFDGVVEKLEGVVEKFEAAVKEKNPNQLTEAEATSQLDSPILLSMNPPILRQPIPNQASDSNNGWAWSEAVEEVQSESTDSPSKNTNSDVEDQDEMPTIHGPAGTGIILIEEEATDENGVDSDTATEEEDAEGTESDATPSVNDLTTTPPKQEATVPRQPLSPEMKNLRDGVRQTIAVYSKPLLNTRDNTVAQLLDVCEAFGCEAEVMYVDQKRKINAFANLCSNYPCAGYRPLKLSKGRIEPRLGYGFQEKPGQMLAVMALSRVPENYPIQFSEKATGTVADLVEREKETCRSREDLSFKLIGISRYTPSGETWKSETGKTWTVERLLSEVLKQPVQLDNVAGTNRLMAISYALDQRIRSGKPIEGPYAKAAKYIADFQDYALSMVNSDGTWHPRFFRAKGAGNPDMARLQATGHILRWLAFSLPEERLQDPRVVKAVSQVHRSLGGNARYGLASSSPQAIDSRLTAVHALVLYNDRLFKPYDELVEEATAVETAQNAR